MTPPKPQTALTSILVSGGAQASPAASQLSLGSREHKVAGPLLGSVPLLVPSGGHVKVDKPKFWRGEGGGGRERRCNSQFACFLHPSKRTNLSLVLRYWTLPVLKIVAAPGPGAGGSKPLHGDKTETLMTWVDLQVHRNIIWKTPFLSPSSNPLSGMEGAQDPSPPPSYSLKISKDCFSLSAQLTVLWAHPRLLRWKSSHSQGTPFAVPLGLALTWNVPGEATASPSSVVCSCHKCGHPNLLRFNPAEEV